MLFTRPCSHLTLTQRFDMSGRTLTPIDAGETLNFQLTTGTEDVA